MREERWFSVSGSAGGANSEPAIDFNLLIRRENNRFAHFA
jgi:hypothetical protein